MVIQAAVASGNKATECKLLKSFLAEVRVQTGRLLTPAQAALLTSDAQRLQAALHC
jgi:hypothetical protein